MDPNVVSLMVVKNWLWEKLQIKKTVAMVFGWTDAAHMAKNADSSMNRLDGRAKLICWASKLNIQMKNRIKLFLNWWKYFSDLF